MSLRATAPRPARTSHRAIEGRRTTVRPAELHYASPPRAAFRVVAHAHLDAPEHVQQKESTSSVVFGLGGALWMVLSLVKPLDAGPALFWTWLLIGAFLPGAALLTTMATRLRTFRDMRIHHFLAMAIVGGMLARSITLGAQHLLIAVFPSLAHGWGWLFTDVFVNETALVFVSLAFLGLLTRGQITVRRAMFVSGGVGTVFSSFELMRELTTAMLAGADTAAMSVHVLEHSLLLPFGHPLWTSLLVGAIVRYRRNLTVAEHSKRNRLLIYVAVGQSGTVLFTEVVPGVYGGAAIFCLILALLVGVALTPAWRELIRYSADEEKAPKEYVTLYRRPARRARV